MAMTNSAQETLLKELAEYSLAAPFVFVPDNLVYKDEEPADLVWACNNCIILMYLTERKHYPNEVKRINVREDAIKHNLKQAHRWLKQWKKGHNLSGNNGFQTFSLSYDSKCHVVILSIIKCKDAVAEFHDEKAVKLGVRACVTLPQSAIEDIVTGGGTTLDILNVLDYLRERRGTGPIPEKDVLDITFGYGRAACEAEGIDKVWPNGRIDDSFHEATYPLLAARRQKSKEDFKNRPTDPVSMASLNDVFNDINMGEFFHLSMEIRKCIDYTKNDPAGRGQVITAESKLKHYDFKFFFVFGITDAVWSTIEADAKEWRSASATRHGPIVIIDTQSDIFQIFLDKRTGSSQTELLLEKWATRCPPAFG